MTFASAGCFVSDLANFPDEDRKPEAQQRASLVDCLTRPAATVERDQFRQVAEVTFHAKNEVL